ncbi:MAG: carboxypeptidase-like regulatory domain-containing protein, partial [Thermoanaerobaculia bacterium]
MKTSVSSLLQHVLLLLSIFLIAAPLAAQSNTATIVVNVVDQAGAVVNDARISVVNNATGAVREIASETDGSATFPALSLTGTYKVVVSKAGFGNEERNDITLRSGETATLKVKLVVGAQAADVTVFGTTQGVRADPQIGRRLDSKEIDEITILGRKISTLPLLNSAFRQGKGTGDLFVNATYFVTGAGSR